MCFECPENCIFCEKTLCLECQNSTFLNNGQCVSTCPNDKYPKNGRCLWKSPLCEEYAMDESGNCLECTYLDPALILNGKCTFSCPEGTMRTGNNTDSCSISCPSNCTYCSSSASCLLCNEGFIISSNGNCITSCPIG